MQRQISPHKAKHPHPREISPPRLAQCNPAHQPDLKYFCENCQLATCEACYLTHMGHSVLPLKLHFQKRLDSLKKLLLRSKKQIAELKEEQELAEDKINKDFSSQIVNTQKMFGDLIMEIQKMCMATINSLESFRHQTISLEVTKMTETVKKLDNVKELLKGTISQMESLLERNDFVSMVNTVNEEDLTQYDSELTRIFSNTARAKNVMVPKLADIKIIPEKLSEVIVFANAPMDIEVDSQRNGRGYYDSKKQTEPEEESVEEESEELEDEEEEEDKAEEEILSEVPEKTWRTDMLNNRVDNFDRHSVDESIVGANEEEEERKSFHASSIVDIGNLKDSEIMYYFPYKAKTMFFYCIPEKTTLKRPITKKPVTYQGFATARVGSCIYLCGGFSQYNGNLTYVLDISKKKFSELEKMLFRRHLFPLLSIKGLSLYAIGGKIYKDLQWQETETCDIYDIQSNMWSKAPRLNEKKSRVAAAAANNEIIFAFGGNRKKDLSGIEKLNIPKKDGWEIINLKWRDEGWIPRRSANAIQITNDSILIFGGYNNGNDSFLFNFNSYIMQKHKPLSKYTLIYDSYHPPFIYKSNVYAIGDDKNIHIYHIDAKKWSLISEDLWIPENSSPSSQHKHP